MVGYGASSGGWLGSGSTKGTQVFGEQAVREHFFYVAVARFVFQHREHGVVSVRDPIRLADAERYGLSPLLI